MNRFHGAAAAAVALLAFGCQSGKAPGEPLRQHEPTPKTASAGQRPVFVRGPTNGAPVAPFIARAVAEGQRGRWNVLVYVGATWCEPCQRFHEALTAGEFDAILPGAHVIEFDLDADKEALAAAGYTSRLIPLFCVPKADGTASERRIEGSIKGPDAVKQNLLPRIRSFLEGSNAG